MLMHRKMLTMLVSGTRRIRLGTTAVPAVAVTDRVWQHCSLGWQVCRQSHGFSPHLLRHDHMQLELSSPPPPPPPLTGHLAPLIYRTIPPTRRPHINPKFQKFYSQNLNPKFRKIKFPKSYSPNPVIPQPKILPIDPSYSSAQNTNRKTQIPNP